MSIVLDQHRGWLDSSVCLMRSRLKRVWTGVLRPIPSLASAENTLAPACTSSATWMMPKLYVKIYKSSTSTLGQVSWMHHCQTSKKLIKEYQATVRAIGALTENHQEYIAQPFLISTTCKSETAEQHCNLLQLAWRACDERKSLIGGVDGQRINTSWSQGGTEICIIY